MSRVSVRQGWLSRGWTKSKRTFGVAWPCTCSHLNFWTLLSDDFQSGYKMDRRHITPWKCIKNTWERNKVKVLVAQSCMTLQDSMDCNQSGSSFQAKISAAAAAAAKSLQSCPTLCDPIDGSTPGSPVPGILQARTLEWVAISFSNAWKWKVKVKSLCRVQLIATPWTLAAHQAPLSMGFSRQEYWSRLLFPSPGDLPDPGIQSVSPALQADSLPSELPRKSKNTRWSGVKLGISASDPSKRISC